VAGQGTDWNGKAAGNRPGFSAFRLVPDGLGAECDRWTSHGDVTGDGQLQES